MDSRITRQVPLDGGQAEAFRGEKNSRKTVDNEDYFNSQFEPLKPFYLEPGQAHWSDDQSLGGIPLDTERVFFRAADADHWINPSFYRSMDTLFAADSRFAKFAAAKQGKVFNNTRQVGPKGGNAIWESGIMQPDKVLADLIHIFHPELLPEHEFVFYERLE